MIKIRKVYKLANNGTYHRQIMAWKLGQEDIVGGLRRRSKRNQQKWNIKSPIEERLALILKQFGISFERNQYIGKYEVDFLLEDKKLVIEANGKHYHTQQKDSRKANYLYNRGYRVIQIRGTDIMNHPREVLRAIIWRAKLRGIKLGVS